ncbi:MAG: hypothetical protein KGN84_20230 [Acidobacteriota bacterium]|nr:hypothetical protein [Acidobacteriota bacterium]
MSFLDNLENNLKSLEANEAANPRDSASRERERGRAIEAAPWAERLKNDPWTAQLIQQMTRAGFARRTKVNLAWIGTALRLEARGQKLELRPGPKGIAAVFLHGYDETGREPVNLSEDPKKIVDRFMAIVDERKRLDDEAARKALAEIEDEELPA